jgi:dolichyl-phosphate-mannose-protein mannosyltransferase
MRISPPNRIDRRRWRIAAMAAVALLALAAARVPAAQRNILLNGDLDKGTENQPDDWRTEAWINGPAAVRYTWIHPAAGRPGTVEVENIKPNDGRWMQSLTLPAGWYYCSADLRTENVGTAATGATISMMEDGIMSSDVRGTTDWQRLGFYVKVTGSGADVDIALRVGGFGSLNVGRAFFRDARVERIAAPPPNAHQVFDLMAIRKASATGPIGTPITMVATFLVLAAIAIWGWRRFPLELPAPAPREPAAAKPKAGKRK